ncbi:MAG: tagaturonate reductase [Acutalibacteraceae bacterium]|nr:tagaturonate reductase [Acutalibacteraceae bacterium]
MRLTNAPVSERIIQFGEGGFLRGFADWMIQKMTDAGIFEGKVVVVQPIENGTCDLLTAQNCKYTHILRGDEGVETSVIDVISRCVKPYDDFESYLALADIPSMRFIISNTTESGIVFNDTDTPKRAPYISFPAKLTLLLKRRYDRGFGGFILLPCELIDRNGDNLKKCVLQYAHLWSYPEDFKEWIEKENVFCNTLVDRINTGYPKDEVIELGYEDKMINTSEFFHLWVIETDFDLERELPFSCAGLNVIITKDKLEDYRTRKVRILNGAHTSLTPYALLSGFDTVKSCMDNKVMREHIRKCVFDEIIPTLDLPRGELWEYAEQVFVRFSNPYIKHHLSSIALNSVDKFKVRVLPSILEYRRRFNTLPGTLIFAFAKLIDLYRTDMTNDTAEVTDFMKTASVRDILGRIDYWGEDLSFMHAEVMKYVTE